MLEIVAGLWLHLQCWVQAREVVHHLVQHLRGLEVPWPALAGACQELPLLAGACQELLQVWQERRRA
jgi:hypothetical protein